MKKRALPVRISEGHPIAKLGNKLTEYAVKHTKSAMATVAKNGCVRKIQQSNKHESAAYR